MLIRDLAVIVTGGRSGLGAATVKLFSDLGAKVAFFDIDEAAASENVEAAGVTVFPCRPT